MVIVFSEREVKIFLKQINKLVPILKLFFYISGDVILLYSSFQVLNRRYERDLLGVLQRAWA
jgi:hypothetical protein